MNEDDDPFAHFNSKDSPTIIKPAAGRGGRPAPAPAPAMGASSPDRPMCARLRRRAPGRIGRCAHRRRPEPAAAACGAAADGRHAAAHDRQHPNPARCVPRWPTRCAASNPARALPACPTSRWWPRATRCAPSSTSVRRPPPGAAPAPGPRTACWCSSTTRPGAARRSSSCWPSWARTCRQPQPAGTAARRAVARLRGPLPRHGQRQGSSSTASASGWPSCCATTAGRWTPSSRRKWQGVASNLRLGDGIPLWVVAALAAGLLLVLFFILQFTLNGRTNDTFNALQAFDVKARPASRCQHRRRRWRPCSRGWRSC
jgi:hypothetical protein